MVDYSPPFCSTGPRRYPTQLEKSGGFPCEGADYMLFNGLEYTLQQEVGEVISHAGLTPSNGDLTQLRQAIKVMLAEAIYDLDLPPDPPDPDLSDFILQNSLRTTLPILPFVMNSTGRAGVYSPGAGYVRIPGNVWITHRGIYRFSTHETTFTTEANKTYHVRWRYVDGNSVYSLLDLADSGYNPDELDEDDAYFDSSYDDMLLARVVTTGANSVQVTDLSNLQALSMIESIDSGSINTSVGWTTLAGSGLSLNWARTPYRAEVGLTMVKHQAGGVAGVAAPTSGAGLYHQIGVKKGAVNRYSCEDLSYTYHDTLNNYGSLSALWAVEA